jgi:hypothetical protein
MVRGAVGDSGDERARSSRFRKKKEARVPTPSPALLTKDSPIRAAFVPGDCHKLDHLQAPLSDRMSDPTAHLRTLAQRVAGSYIARTEPRAILLVGSGALGEADCYSDLDLVLYYDELPSDESVRRGAA